MNLLRQLILLLAIILPIPSFAGGIGDVRFTQFSTPDGLPNSMAHGIYQDRDGFLWIPTFYGLFRYDGSNVRTYKSNIYTPGLLVNNNVLCVAEDLAHRLWIGTHGGLCVLDKRGGRMKAMRLESVTRQRLNRICVTKDNRVFLGYISGMAYYDSKRDTPVRMTKGNCKGDVPADINIQAIMEYGNGNLLIGTWKNGLYRYNTRENRFTHYPPLDETNSVMDLFKDSQGTIWAGTSGGGIHKLVFSSDMKTVTVARTFRHETGKDTSLPSDFIYSIHEDLITRSLWAGTRNGIAIMPFAEEGVFTNYSETSKRHFLPIGEVNTVMRDRNGMMWISTKGAGVFSADTRRRPFEVTIPGSNGGKRNEYIATVLVTKQAGTAENGGEAMYAGCGYGIEYTCGNVRTTIMPTGRPYHISYSNIYKEVLAAVHDEGILVCRDGKMVRQYKRSNCNFIPHDLVYCVHEDKKGNWWVASYKGLGVRYADGRELCFSKSPHADRLLTRETTAIVSDNDGSLWLATAADGIIHITGNMDNPQALRCKSYTTGNGRLPAGTPLCFLIDNSGSLWVGTEGSGLCLYDSQKDLFRSVHQQYNLPGDMVASMETDSGGNLWIGTNQGLARLSVTGERAGHARIFTTADGLPDNFFSPNASCRSGGRFYFGTTKGIVSFGEDMGEGGKSDDPLRITDIIIDGHPLETMESDARNDISPYTPDFTDRLTIPSEYSGFTVCFASLNYRQQQKTKYAYRLVGYDAVWHHADATMRTASYSHLPAGKYTLEIKATGENGEWGKVRTLSVDVLPPFYATWQAFVLYAILLALAMFGAWWETRRRLMLRNKRHVQEGETDKVHHLKLQIFSNIPTDEERFLDDAVACVNRHIADADFNVTQFVEEMATSRTVLHKKLKSITGLNTTAFVRSLRLKAACRILDENPAIRISELAYRVGFNDPKYFSICFKKEFGMQPTEYAAKAGEEE